MKNLKYYFAGTLVLATFFIWYAVYAESRGDLIVAFLDVGQGDAILTAWTQYIHMSFV